MRPRRLARIVLAGSFLVAPGPGLARQAADAAGLTAGALSVAGLTASPLGDLSAVPPRPTASTVRSPSPSGSLCPTALSSRLAAAASLLPGAAPASAPGYAAQLSTTPLGWPRLDRWCVWIEPAAPGDSAAALQSRRWHQAVLAALQAWEPLLPLERVQAPGEAQIRIWRRRPPLARDASGRLRASNGRSLLTLLSVEREPGRWRLEPAVELLIDPGRRAEALQGTALHELGHAFGLWGHSPDSADALAERPGPLPVLRPSSRDRATLLWLQAQPTPFGATVRPVPAPGAGAPP